jgi:uncharacterized membrane protein YeaQ/YmgE (transglycosylase-associated protein family)
VNNNKTGRETAIELIRWLLVIPAAWIGFYLSMLVAMLSMQLLNGWCPGGTISSGQCSIGWINHAPFLVGAAVAPALVLYFGTRMAPSHKIAVAWALYGIGAMVALFFFRIPGAVPIAGIVGAATAVFISWKDHARSGVAHNHSLDRPAAP